MWKVAIIESERGWGRKIDEVKEFVSYEDAKRFQIDFNKDNTELVAPDWYMAAENPVFDSTILDKAIMNK